MNLTTINLYLSLFEGQSRNDRIPNGIQWNLFFLCYGIDFGATSHD